MQSRRSAPRPYTRRIEILVLCTANQCRSPMAEALLRAHLDDAGIDATVASAGEMRGGVHASPGAIRALAARGVDLRRHLSRTVTAEMVARADLVLAMARRHLRNAVALDRDVFARTFTVKELARRAAAVGERHPGQSLEEWLATVHRGRSLHALLGEDPRDDVDDPIGGPDHRYEATAAELDTLLGEIVDLAFPSATSRETA